MAGCRPRRRIYPAKPKLGVRVTQPDELWHVDLTIIKLLNGTKVYLHAVIDNYSRRILAWCMSSTFDVMNTIQILQRGRAGRQCSQASHVGHRLGHREHQRRGR